MMIQKTAAKDLISRLPEVRGRYSPNTPIDKITWFKVGGPAEVLCRPADLNDLTRFLSQRPPDIPIKIIGVGSNLLVRDGGVPGVVIRLGRNFASIETKGDFIKVGAGALDVNVALVAKQACLGGLEFLSGIPGTIGGGLRMNGGAYGSEFKDVFVSAMAIDNFGNVKVLSYQDMGFSYRKTNVPKDWLFVEATLKGHPSTESEISQRMDKISKTRKVSQPVRSPTGGSTFANPMNFKAWELIDRAGCRGLIHGSAKVSEKHCNFLINTGSATAAELESLGEEVRKRVFETSGIILEWEIERIGVPLQEFCQEVGK